MNKREQVYELADALLGNSITVAEAEQLGELVCNDAEARRHYVRFMHESAVLREWGADAPAAEVVPPIVLDLSPAAHHPLTASLSPGGLLFSYAVGAVLMGIGLMMGWTWRVSGYRAPQFAQSASPQAVRRAESEPRAVGRVTGLVDCRWGDPQAGLPARPTFMGAAVLLGRRYTLASGLMEITYDTGAKVVLQGPAAYEVESASGGFLAIGALTAKVESGESRARNEGEKRDRSRLSTLDSRLFSVRTPTAVVTDLGTEFGVQVGPSGATESYVFRGRINVRPTATGSQLSVPVLLGENESATVEVGQTRPIKIVRHAGTLAATSFRPRPVPIELFSTGVGLPEGVPDPHWQIVARRGDPGFKPQAAVVTVAAREYLQNDPARSQWISTSGRLRPMPRGWYTFRTTFDLVGRAPESAVLRGRFFADNHVDAIRLNGHSVTVPEHGTSAPFDQFHSFAAKSGFVAGTNVLEIVVYNLPSLRLQRDDTPMALRVELEGVALRAGRESAAGVPPKDRRPLKP
jgi:hypothetical protein